MEIMIVISLCVRKYTSRLTSILPLQLADGKEIGHVYTHSAMDNKSRVR